MSLPVPVDPPAEAKAEDTGLPEHRGWLRRRPRVHPRHLRRALGVLALGGVLYYGVFGLMLHRIDDDPGFVAPEHLAGGSAAVSVAAALIDREVNQNRWMPNDPAIAPNAFLDNTPNYQLGIQRAVGRFSFELLDQIARRRGSSRMDVDLERASGYLQFPGDVWIFNPGRSFLPTIPSEDQYRQGLRSLVSYNERLARGEAVFERRADALAATLSRIAADLGSQAAQLDNTERFGGLWMFSPRADDVFYQNKGTLYAYHVILAALGQDYEALIRERGVGELWAQAMDSLQRASQLQPLVVLNSASDASIFGNHLKVQGFYMKRAILQLEEVASALAV